MGEPEGPAGWSALAKFWFESEFEWGRLLPAAWRRLARTRAEGRFTVASGSSRVQRFGVRRLNCADALARRSLRPGRRVSSPDGSGKQFAGSPRSSAATRGRAEAEGEDGIKIIMKLNLAGQP